jgi:hypothetical protein
MSYWQFCHFHSDLHLTDFYRRIYDRKIIYGSDSYNHKATKLGIYSCIVGREAVKASTGAKKPADRPKCS